MANNDPTSLAGGQVNINQPGDQPAYTPGQPTAQPAGGGLQAQVATAPASVAPAAPLTPAQTVKNTLDQFGPTPRTDANQLVLDSIDKLTNSGSSYMRDAARRGTELAAARGLGNSSIAAGASQRSAVQAATPFIQQAVGLQGQREGEDAQVRLNAINQALQLSGQREQNLFTKGQQDQQLAFQGQQNQIDRDFREKLQSDSVKQQDWLSDRNFTREFNAQLSTLPIKSAFEMQSLLQKYAVDNPEVYTKEVVSGMTNFFQNNLMQMLNTYFPKLVEVRNSTGV